MSRAVNLLVRLWMAIVICFKWLYRLFSKKASKEELPTYSNEWKDTDREWEDWETEALTVTVVPNNNSPSDPVDPRLKYSTRFPSTAENDPSAEELFHDMQPVFKKPKKLKVFKNEEQPVVSVDTRKFAIDSSFQPSTESEELEAWRDEVTCSWEDDATFDDSELLKVSREALREKRLQDREQRRQQVEHAARLKQEQLKLAAVKQSSNK